MEVDQLRCIVKYPESARKGENEKYVEHGWHRFRKRNSPV